MSIIFCQVSRRKKEEGVKALVSSSIDRKLLSSIFLVKTCNWLFCLSLCSRRKREKIYFQFCLFCSCWRHEILKKHWRLCFDSAQITWLINTHVSPKLQESTKQLFYLSYRLISKNNNLKTASTIWKTFHFFLPRIAKHNLHYSLSG